MLESLLNKYVLTKQKQIKLRKHYRLLYTAGLVDSKEMRQCVINLNKYSADLKALKIIIKPMLSKHNMKWERLMFILDIK